MEARRAEACPAIRRLAPRLVAVLGGFALAVLPDGRTRKKTKAQRNDDRVRFDTLCEAIWNVTGRQEPLEALTGKSLAA